MSAPPDVWDQHLRRSAGRNNGPDKPLDFLPQVLGDWLIAEHGVLAGADRNLWRYEAGKGLYVPGEPWVRQLVVNNHGMYYMGRVADTLVSWLKNRLDADPEDLARPLPGGLVNVANGVLDPWTEKLYEHSPEYRTCIQLPVAWDDSATCPAIDTFLEQALSADCVDLFWQFLGYVISGSNKYQKALLAKGPGGNGKTRTLDVVRGVIGAQNFTAMSLQQVSDNRFMTANLYGKLANVCGDIGRHRIEHSEVIKAIIGGDPIEAERKGVQGFTFQPFTVMVFSANEWPKVLDSTMAFFDRFLIFDMPTVFRATPLEDPNLREKITAPSELRGALVKAVRALRGLEEQGRFEDPASSARLRTEWRMSSDSRVAFLQDHVTTGCDRINKAVLYTVYSEYCREQGVFAQSARNFNEAVRSHFQITERTLDGRDFWPGLCCGLASTLEAWSGN